MELMASNLRMSMLSVRNLSTLYSTLLNQPRRILHLLFCALRHQQAVNLPCNLFHYDIPHIYQRAILITITITPTYHELRISFAPPTNSPLARFPLLFSTHTLVFHTNGVMDGLGRYTLFLFSPWGAERQRKKHTLAG